MENESKEYWAITPKALSELINKKRGELNKSPIDHGAMKTRLILKSNVNHPGLFDFESSELQLDADKISILERLIDDQFGIYMENKLSRHCKFHPAKKEEPVSPPSPQISNAQPQKSGLMSKLGRMLGR